MSGFGTQHMTPTSERVPSVGRNLQINRNHDNPSTNLGELACFTRPEMKVERVSYPVITPSAARGLLEAILYRPQFRWRIRRIAVKQPIRFLSFRRNEVKSRLSVRNPESLNVEEDRTQRNTLALRDVEYVVEASLHLSITGQLAAPPGAEPG